VDSPACTWQSKEAINHEDNASSPLSEPGSLGWRALLGADEYWQERERERERERKREEEEKEKEKEREDAGTSKRIREATSRRSAQKVNRLPGS